MLSVNGLDTGDGYGTETLSSSSGNDDKRYYSYSENKTKGEMLYKYLETQKRICYRCENEVSEQDNSCPVCGCKNISSVIDEQTYNELSTIDDSTEEDTVSTTSNGDSTTDDDPMLTVMAVWFVLGVLLTIVIIIASQ